jgi:hypothetical protein
MHRGQTASIVIWPMNRPVQHRDIALAHMIQAARAALLAMNGVGLAHLALFHIGSDIKAGRLVPVPLPGALVPVGHGGTSTLPVLSDILTVPDRCDIHSDNERCSAPGRPLYMLTEHIYLM